MDITQPYPPANLFVPGYGTMAFSAGEITLPAITNGLAVNIPDLNGIDALQVWSLQGWIYTPGNPRYMVPFIQKASATETMWIYFAVTFTQETNIVFDTTQVAQAFGWASGQQFRWHAAHFI